MISLQRLYAFFFIEFFLDRLLKKLKLKSKLIENFPFFFFILPFFLFVSYELDTNQRNSNMKNAKKYKKEILFLSFVIFIKFQKIFLKISSFDVSNTFI